MNTLSVLSFFHKIIIIIIFILIIRQQFIQSINRFLLPPNESWSSPFKQVLHLHYHHHHPTFLFVFMLARMLVHPIRYHEWNHTYPFLVIIHLSSVIRPFFLPEFSSDNFHFTPVQCMKFINPSSRIHFQFARRLSK